MLSLGWAGPAGAQVLSLGWVGRALMLSFHSAPHLPCSAPAQLDRGQRRLVPGVLRESFPVTLHWQGDRVGQGALGKWGAAGLAGVP